MPPNAPTTPNRQALPWQQEAEMFDAAAQQETARLRALMTQPGADLDALAQEFGALAARVRAVEELLLRLNAGGSSMLVRAAPPVKLESSWEQSALEWADRPNFGSLEEDKQGRHFRWSGENPVIHFSLPILRTAERFLTVVVFGVIKTEYLGSLKICIDGQPVTHRLAFVEGLNHIQATIPSLELAPGEPERAESTQLRILLPASHSPKELGVSADRRKLGIAIGSIRVGLADLSQPSFLGRMKRLVRGRSKEPAQS